eukprot:m.182707 g.182707  ORF g.182707 m.182707 type:complete len:96 (-) comp16645_c1_seq1:118-405(-)
MARLNRLALLGCTGWKAVDIIHLLVVIPSSLPSPLSPSLSSSFPVPFFSFFPSSSPPPHQCILFLSSLRRLHPLHVSPDVGPVHYSFRLLDLARV